MTDNKAQTLLTDWAANLISPESSTSFYDKNVLALDSASYSKHAFRSDIPLYKGGTTLDVYRQRISCLLKDQLTELQLKAAFLYFTSSRNKYAQVARALNCNPETVTTAVNKAIRLVKGV